MAKLIRTGNTVYTYNEFCRCFNSIKKEGQLYNMEIYIMFQKLQTLILQNTF